jgi:hypothetical protein
VSPARGERELKMEGERKAFRDMQNTSLRLEGIARYLSELKN